MRGREIVHGRLHLGGPRTVMMENPMRVSGLAAMKPPVAIVDQIKVFGELDATGLVVGLQTPGPEYFGDFANGRHGDG